MKHLHQENTSVSSKVVIKISNRYISLPIPHEEMGVEEEVHFKMMNKIFVLLLWYNLEHLDLNDWLKSKILSPLKMRERTQHLVWLWKTAFYLLKYSGKKIFHW